MILDNLLTLSKGQALASAVGDYASTNIIDFKGFDIIASQDAPYGVNRDVAKGNQIPLLCQVTEDFASGGAGTLLVTLQVDDDVAFGTAEDLYTSQAFALADLIAGKLLLPQVVPFGANKRYMRGLYTIAGATMTAGAVELAITTAIQQNR